MNDYLNQFDLNYKATIRRRAITNDSYCNQSVSCTTLVVDAPCAVWQAVGNEIVIGDRVHNPINYVMAIKPSTEYAATDRVIISGSSFTLGNPHNVAKENAIMIFNLESVE